MKTLVSALCLVGVLMASDPGQQKLEKIRKLEAESDYGVIPFTVKQYKEFVLENPRPYDVVTLFTVRSGCDECQSVYNEMTGVQYSFKQAKEDVFFGVFYYSQEAEVREIFLKHGIKTVPHICTSKQELKRDQDADFYRTEDVWFIKKDDTHETQVQLDFINKRLNHQVGLKLPLTTVLMKNVILFTVLTGVITLVIKLRPVLIDPNLWWLISLMGYIVCTSGFIYSELHGMPMFRFEKDQYGNLFVGEYFMKQQRSQYAGEGYIVSILSVLTSACFLMFVRNETFFGQQTSQFRLYLLIGFLALGYMGIEAYLTCYKIKTPWYKSNFFPPQDYIRGPLQRDQGNNI